MPTYNVTSPDGQKYRITTPYEASQEELMDYVQTKLTPQEESQESSVADTAKYYANEVGQGVGQAGRALTTGIYSIADTARPIGDLASAPFNYLGDKFDIDFLKKKELPLASEIGTQTFDKLTKNAFQPRNQMEQSSQNITSNLAPMLLGKLPGAPAFLKVNSPLEAISNFGAAAGGEIANKASEDIENPLLKSVVRTAGPLIGGLAPATPMAAANVVTRGLGKMYGIDKNLIASTEAGGLDPIGPAVTNKPVAKKVMAYQQRLPGGMPLQEAVREADALAMKRISDLGYNPEATPTRVGKSTAKGLEKSVAARRNEGVQLQQQAKALLPEDAAVPTANVEKRLADISGRGKLAKPLVDYTEGTKSYKLLKDTLMAQPKQVPEPFMKMFDAVGNRVENLSTELMDIDSKLKAHQEVIKSAPFSATRTAREEMGPLTVRKQQITKELAKEQGMLNEISSVMEKAPRQINPEDLEKITTILGRQVGKGEGLETDPAIITKQVFGAGKSLEEDLYANASPEALAKYEKGNELYRSGSELKRLQEDAKLVGDKRIIEGEVVGDIAPETTFKNTHNLMKNEPTTYKAVVSRMAPQRQKVQLVGDIRELGGGQHFDILKYADNLTDGISKESRDAMFMGNKPLEEAHESLANALKNYKDVGGFAGQKEPLPVLGLNSLLANAGAGTFALLVGGVTGKGAAAGIGFNALTSRMLANPDTVKAMAGLTRLYNKPYPVQKGAILNTLKDSILKDEELDEGTKEEAAKAIDVDIEKAQEEKVLEKELELKPLPKKQSSIPPDIIEEEGLRLKPYKDARGYTTVGIGFNMDNPTARKVWKEAGVTAPFQAVKQGRQALTEAEAKKLAQKSYEIAKNDTKRLYPNFNKMSKNRQRALVNLSYQLGGPKLAEFDKANRAIRNGRFDVAAKHLAMSAWAKQTPERAKRIIAMLKEDKPYEKQS